MKRNKRRRPRRGGFLMTAGLLLIAAALLLTVHNLREQQAAEEAAFEALGELLGSIPQKEESEPSGLVLADEQGHALDWPLDAQGEPMAWPVGEDGLPVQTVTDDAGRVHAWANLRLGALPAPAQGTPSSQTQQMPPIGTQEASISAGEDVPGRQEETTRSAAEPEPLGETAGGQDLTGWTRDAHGALLPWIRDASGRLMPWPTDSEGLALPWAQLGQAWSALIDALFPYLIRATASLPAFVLYPDMEMPTESVDGQVYIGVVEVPSLELSLPVISEWSYPRLKKAPCRFVGSVYSRDIVICGHNYERHFGRLKELSIGDEVRFTDVEGNVFFYSVCAMEQLEKKAVEEMMTGDWDLTLFTCTKGGLNRVTVRCKLERYTAAQEGGE
ncbi:MAG: sortase [Clostridiales bacterium]|nr:sortase [Clostridiales bacterium]